MNTNLLFWLFSPIFLKEMNTFASIWKPFFSPLNVWDTPGLQYYLSNGAARLASSHVSSGQVCANTASVFHQNKLPFCDGGSISLSGCDNAKCVRCCAAVCRRPSVKPLVRCIEDICSSRIEGLREGLRRDVLSRRFIYRFACVSA